MGDKPRLILVREDVFLRQCSSAFKSLDTQPGPATALALTCLANRARKKKARKVDRAQTREQSA